MSVTPARACAFRVLVRVLDAGAWADRALHAEAGALEPRERALAQTLVFGAVQRRRTLDYVIERFSSRPIERLDVSVRAALELGAYQLLLLDGISDYAAVSESVELVKRAPSGLRSASFVNAVLRRVARDGAALVVALDDAEPTQAAILHSVPDWLAELWFSELGSEAARALLRTVNRPAESAVRVNTLKVRDPAPLVGELGVSVQRAPRWVAAPGLPELPEALVLSERFDLFQSPQWRAGLLTAQSRASMAVARALAPEPGERVLDLCASPGAKTTHLAALMAADGELVAVERNVSRARALERNCRRMGAYNVKVLTADARQPAGGQFDRVLLDPPCSGLGTLRSRPDLRWAAGPGEIQQLAVLQSQLLRAAAEQCRPGGVLVYSLCTISAREGGGVIEAFIASDPRFSVEQQWSLAPALEGSDGFYIARLRRAGGSAATGRANLPG